MAILLDFDASVSLDFNAPRSGLPYRPQAEAFFAAAQRLGRGVDVVFDGSALARYRVVIAPLLRLMDGALAAALKDYVSNGDILVATALTATLDRDHVAPAGRPPYLLHDLFGVERIEWGSLGRVAAPPKGLMGKDAQPWGALPAAAGTIPVRASRGHGLDGA